VNYLHPRGRSW